MKKKISKSYSRLSLITALYFRPKSYPLENFGLLFDLSLWACWNATCLLLKISGMDLPVASASRQKMHLGCWTHADWWHLAWGTAGWRSPT